MAKQEIVEHELDAFMEAFIHRIKSDRATGCLIWTGATSGQGGYGTLRRSLKDKSRYAHRYAYEITYGDIPLDSEIDHVCSNRLCVNPEHLEAISHANNIRRGFARRRLNQAVSGLENLGLKVSIRVEKGESMGN